MFNKMTPVILLTFAFFHIASCELMFSCSSPIYCHGSLLHTVQMARIFNDSKTFVDMQMRFSEADTLSNFENFMNNTENNPTRQQVSNFVSENFSDDEELEKFLPNDWNRDPDILKKINDTAYRQWARELNELWLKLARKVRQDVVQNPKQHSLEPLPNGFIIPGGRFKEPYYWDSYWIVSGLLLTNMTDTARGMIENFAWLIQKYGYIPNGGRVYYSMRSQPPLFSAMVARYIETTNNLPWLKKHLKFVEKELEWWLQHRTMQVGNYTLAHYFAPSIGPRPESYAEDVLTTNGNQDIYSEIKSAAESGWDFSFRWVVDINGTNNGNLSNIKTSRVTPVDLNAFLCGAFNNLAQLYLRIGNMPQFLKWERKANEWKEAIEKLMWNEEYGIWFDVLNTTKQRINFYPSNVSPLWTNCIPAEKNLRLIGDRVADYLKKSGALEYLGGLPASLNHTGEQWDLPNAWPPLQGMVVQALLRSKSEKAVTVGKQITERWVRANLIGYRSSQEMYEKYDAEEPGKFGGGGEYIVQAGFGWTNGVILEMLNDSGDWLKDDFPD